MILAEKKGFVLVFLHKDKALLPAGMETMMVGTEAETMATVAAPANGHSTKDAVVPVFLSD